MSSETAPVRTLAHVRKIETKGLFDLYDHTVHEPRSCMDAAIPPRSI
jgi:hypothetical protein